MQCSCGKLKVGMQITEHRNWNPDCTEHGLGSEWWQSREQVANREKQNQLLRALQKQATEARKKVRESKQDD